MPTNWGIRYETASICIYRNRAETLCRIVGIASMIQFIPESYPLVAKVKPEMVIKQLKLIIAGQYTR